MVGSFVCFGECVVSGRGIPEFGQWQILVLLVLIRYMVIRCKLSIINGFGLKPYTGGTALGAIKTADGTRR